MFVFSKSLKCNDHDHDGRLSLKEFMKALHELRIELLEKETVMIFQTFDPRHTGNLYIDEFMNRFVPQVQSARIKVCDELNDRLVENTFVSFNRVKKTYNARGHPDFASGIKPDYVIKQDFMEMLDLW